MKAAAVVPGEKAVSIEFLRRMGELRRHVRAQVNGIWRRYLWRASRLAMLECMDNAVASSGMEPVTDRVSSLGKTADAYEYLASGKHFGNVVIRV